MIELILALIVLVMAFGAFYLMWWHVFKETNNMFNRYAPERVKPIAEEINEDPLSIEIDECVENHRIENGGDMYGSILSPNMLDLYWGKDPQDYLDEISIDAHHYDSYKI